MKFSSTYAWFVLALVVGFVSGWLVKGDGGGNPEAVDADGRSIAKESRTGSGALSSKKVFALTERGKELDRFHRVLEEIPQLSPEVFADRLLALMRDGLTPEEIMEQSAMLTQATTEQGAEFFRLYSKSRSLGREGHDPREIRKFLLTMGRRDGKRFLELVGGDLGAGYRGIASLTKGWTLSNPNEAVDWFNALPEGYPQQEFALRGILDGVAQQDAEGAIYIFNELHAEDYKSVTVGGFASALFSHHGVSAIDTWLLTEPDPKVERQVLEVCLTRGNARSAKEVVPWAASLLDEHPELAQEFRSMYNKQIRKNIDESVASFSDFAGQDSHSMKSLEIMTQQLCKSGNGDLVDEWLAANQSAPGFSTVDRVRTAEMPAEQE